jgi:hypothetical protein
LPFLPLAAATQYFWLAESNIGLLPLTCPLCSVVYTIVKQPKGGKTMEIENEVTIATHNGSQVARQHNLRKADSYSQ